MSSIRKDTISPHHPLGSNATLYCHFHRTLCQLHNLDQNCLCSKMRLTCIAKYSVNFEWHSWISISRCPPTSTLNARGHGWRILWHVRVYVMDSVLTLPTPTPCLPLSSSAAPLYTYEEHRGHGKKGQWTGLPCILAILTYYKGHLEPLVAGTI